MKKLKKFIKWYLIASIGCAAITVIYAMIVPPSATSTTSTVNETTTAEQVTECSIKETVPETTIAETTQTVVVETTTAAPVETTVAETIPPTIQAVETEPTTVMEETDSPSIDYSDDDEYKSLCAGVTYADILNNPEYYIEAPVFFSATVISEFDNSIMSSGHEFGLDTKMFPTGYLLREGRDTNYWQIYTMTDAPKIYTTHTIHVWGNVLGINGSGEIIVAAKYIERIEN